MERCFLLMTPTDVALNPSRDEPILSEALRFPTREEVNAMPITYEEKNILRASIR